MPGLVNERTDGRLPRGDDEYRPTLLSVGDNVSADEFDSFLAEHPKIIVHDTINQIADDLFEMREPSGKWNDTLRRAFVNDVARQGLRFGAFAYYPWKNLLLRVPKENDLVDLRSFRDEGLVTCEEHSELYKKKVGVFGLSVGSNIDKQLVVGGIGNHHVIADKDIVDHTGLNRTDYTLEDIGLEKAVARARHNALDNPYIEHTLYREGFTPAMIGHLAMGGLDLFVEEMDDVVAKAQARKFCMDHNIPLVMVGDIEEYVVLDIERHDREKVAPFNGRVTKALFEALAEDGGDMTDKDKQRALKSIASTRHVISSQRMMASLMERGRTLGGIPQLGSTARAGAALAGVAAREILLGNKMNSGTYVLDIRRKLRLGPRAKMRDYVRTLEEFLKFAKSDD